MAPAPFRRAAVVCSIVTATLGVGVLVPVSATAATAPAASTAPSTSDALTPDAIEGNPDLDAIPVDPSLGAPRFLNDWSTLHGARTVIGDAGRDAVWLVAGDTVHDYSPPGGAFVLTVQDRHKDAGLEVIRVHTAEDGTQTRTERIPMPWTITVTGAEAQNSFTPGKNRFTGTATAGATITATDATGATLFSTETTGSRSGVGTWSADAVLADTDYAITLTQTTPSGETNQLRGITYTPSTADAPPAPTVDETYRALDGSFMISGKLDAPAESILVEDEAGASIADGSLNPSGYVAKVPNDRIGSTVYVVARSADNVRSPRVPVALEQLPTDSSISAPSLRSVTVHPNGRVQVVGEHDDAPGLWILDGDRVVGSVSRSDAAWSYSIDPAATDKQLTIANLSFDGRDLSGLSERVLLPRLLQVDGIAEQNTYTPGARAFSGKAEAGATITATDQDGHELFSTEVSDTRSGVGTWSGSADLTSRDGYEVTFTQTTTDGRTSIMRNIGFDAETQTVAPATVTTKTVTAGINNTFTGTATPGATIRILNPNGTQIVPGTHDVASDGTWTFDRIVSKGATKFDFVIEQTVDNTVSKSSTFSLTASTDRAVTVTTKTVTAGINNTFTGTATPGATIR
ncbi:hypothetical protein, partial [Curtobacterium sp. VKM Ac-1393]|uniref:hypothetical protein n=1 Tax=Curtobacterium sp. VKM Ac-1393 TaxID=2783814 RepID=UPI001889F3F0